jgi:serine/threonine-protein kinase RsbW
MQNPDWAYAYHSAPPCDMPLDNWKRLELSSLKQVCSITKMVSADMKSLDYPRKDSFAVELALAEAVANAIKHGHEGDPRRTVVVHYHASPAEVLLEVTDEGPGFNPYLFMEPLEGTVPGRFTGQGLFLMRVYMTWIRFNQRGNRVTFCKQRSATS